MNIRSNDKHLLYHMWMHDPIKKSALSKQCTSYNSRITNLQISKYCKWGVNDSNPITLCNFENGKKLKGRQVLL